MDLRLVVALLTASNLVSAVLLWLWMRARSENLRRRDLLLRLRGIDPWRTFRAAADIRTGRFVVLREDGLVAEADDFVNATARSGDEALDG